ncbi:class I SAM-dependent methyltransferase [Reichenbachiella versicolor]|uniref:class I SAM-dependent methyltransferase n=1 Tax=Reichenbachiella versicolor TaxID=1821036 RepID=UPI000D6E7823|nr:class I SAM-dependent methyltransferase [Reichenbachiella versicolor]
MNVQQLNNELGNIDLYLLDQILKAKIPTDAKILDAGCGEGRNIFYFLNNGYDIHGVDINEDAIRMLHFILGTKFPSIPKSNFTLGDLTNLQVDIKFDYIICNAVLHFAESEKHFWDMFNQLNKAISDNGQLFIRMTGVFGLSDINWGDNGIANLEDGSIRFLLTQRIVDKILMDYNFQLVEPLKSVWVDGMRSMTTLIIQKS